MSLPSSPPRPTPKLRLLDCPSLKKASDDDNTIDIESIATKDLHGGRDLAMLLFVDRPNERVLLQVPNDLGWRYHYGLSIPGEGDGDSDRWGDATDACRGALRRQDPEAVAPLRPAGLMLFTFPSVEGHKPMRVRVLENDVSEMSDVQGRYGGSWFDYGRVPYPKMWRDDELWLPRLLEAKDSSFFEGQFVFDGPPGPSSRVVDYKVEFR